jgi:Lactoylglutathione lyase and related lyases
MSFVIKSIYHVQLAAPKDSEEKARSFYRDVLNFKEIEKPEELKGRGGVWFEFPGYQIHIGIEEPFSPAKKAHPAFEVQGIEELKIHLKAKGISCTIDDKLPGANRFYVLDPFGNRLEFLEWLR